LLELSQAFSSPAASDSLLFPDALLAQKMAGFLYTIEPLISQACERVNEECKY
jgi:hypothetical protein